MCVLTAPPTGCSLPLSLLFGPPYSVRHNNIEIGPINNPAVASKGLRERKGHTSLILNQKLEMVKHREEGMLIARLLTPNSQLVNTKEKFLKEIKSAPPVYTQIIRK